MRLSVMQPYIFPYIGYFHLIEASEKIIFYDDVNYIKGGWINRNRILLNNSDFLFTIPVLKASPNKMILEIAPNVDQKFNKKFFKQINLAYQKAPHFNEVNEVLVDVFNKEYENIADMAIQSIQSVYDYIGKDIDWAKSSIISASTKGMDRADRLIKMSDDLGYKEYINVVGGKALYDKEYFKNKGIELNFLQSKTVHYEQFVGTFVPNLSIIDVLMFNDKAAVLELFKAYDII